MTTSAQNARSAAYQIAIGACATTSDRIRATSASVRSGARIRPSNEMLGEQEHDQVEDEDLEDVKSGRWCARGDVLQRDHEDRSGQDDDAQRRTRSGPSRGLRMRWPQSKTSSSPIPRPAVKMSQPTTAPKSPNSDGHQPGLWPLHVPECVVGNERPAYEPGHQPQ